MDKLCKLILQDEQVLYKYRGKVSVPPLEMVDDIISFVKCGSTATAMNAKINAFIETKKLKFGVQKCAKIHFGNKGSNVLCPQQQIHGINMKSSQKEKYLGDFITNKGNSKQTIFERKGRGEAILSEMRAILSEIPLGNWRTKIGLVLRQAWFINGCFFNSEVWSGYSENDLKDLEVIDHQILKAVVGGQAKVQSEMLYLETSQLPIKSVITSRRILYLHNILKRHDSELIRQVYDAMKESPLKEDWIHMVNKDKEDLELNLTDEAISKLSKSEFKKIVKLKVRKLAFIQLENIKKSHSKVKDIIHTNMKAPQSYITSSEFSNKLKSLLFNLRCKGVNEFKSNFYISTCPCKISNDTQEHALQCSRTKQHLNNEHLQLIDSVKYSDLFSNVDLQLRITQAFDIIIKTRERLRTPPVNSAYPGQNTGPGGG